MSRSGQSDEAAAGARAAQRSDAAAPRRSAPAAPLHSGAAAPQPSGAAASKPFRAAAPQPFGAAAPQPFGAAAPRRIIPQDQVDRPLAGFRRDYVDGETVPRHSHARAQLLYATRGVMRIMTDAMAYVVPPGRGLWVPADVPHVTAMQGPVAMRALFLRADAARAGPAEVTVLAVSPLLRELVLAACAEPLEWDEAGRGGHLAALIRDEIARAPALPFGVPAVRDPRLQRLATALRADPARPAGLDAWAAECGASVRTLTRLFRRETGMSFARWRQLLRLQEAAVLLAQGTPPARAAARVGYASAPAFGAAYRACFGASPGRTALRHAPDAALAAEGCHI